jgi:threonine aldolase
VIAPDLPLTRDDCRFALAGHQSHAPAALLHAAAARLGAARPDVYGKGEALAAFEQKIAAVLGHAAAVFVPSGTMAQQIALRIVAEHSGRRAFAGHPTNHIVLHEHAGFARLHGLAFVPLGSAERLATLDDVRAIRERIGTLLIELPQREIGGELPPWDELVAIVAEARARGWHLHLDGARLWECGPAFARPYAEIGQLFDTVYVSFYKRTGRSRRRDARRFGGLRG